MNSFMKDILVGFEFVVDLPHEKNYYEKLHYIWNVFNEISNHINMIEKEEMSTVKPPEEPWELSTKPVVFPKALEILEKVFEIIEKTENIRTCDECGLRINISHKRLKENPNLTSLKMNILSNIEDIKDIFDKKGHRAYYVFRFRNKALKQIKGLLEKNIKLNKALEKVASRFVSKYFIVNPRKNYLEIRVLGGEGYEKKYEEITQLLLSWAKLLEQFYSNKLIIYNKILKILEEFDPKSVENEYRKKFSSTTKILYKKFLNDMNVKDNPEIRKIFRKAVKHFEKFTAGRTNIHYDSLYRIIGQMITALEKSGKQKTHQELESYLFDRIFPILSKEMKW